MDWIVLKNIRLETTQFGTNVQYDYDAPASLQKFTREPTLFIEFPFDVSDVPDAVLTIPFVGIMSTVSMLLEIGIEVPALDHTFHESIPKIESAFRQMYPRSGISVVVKAAQDVNCSFEPSKKTSLFFTGGVDATSALTELLLQKPTLVNIWGGDLWITDDDSHAELETYLDKLTSHVGLDYCFIRTNSRAMFDEDALGHLCEKTLGHQLNHGWWASIAHILSMTTTMAPWLWAEKIASHYIGSSYGGQTCVFDSNSETVIHAINYSSCSFYMVDNSVDRNDKVGKIIQYHNASDAPIQLKVCWQRIAGVNCCACEKCYRTIMNVIANRGDPNDYGFSVNRNTLLQIRRYLKENTVSKAFWVPIQNAFRSECTFWEKVPEISWILNIHLNSPVVYLHKIRRKLFR